MATRVGINGFGRVGRAFLRRALERGDLDVVAINDVTDARTLAHLLEFDSTYGRLGRSVGCEPGALIVDGKKVTVMSQRDPAAIDWGELGVSVVVEFTGEFRAR
jgi:glyceraldehyde 3-phosphate dehydrogenase